MVKVGCLICLLKEQNFGLKTPVRLRDIISSHDVYVYSTSHTFAFPFRFMPITTVAPTNGDFSKAVSFMWNRKDGHFLPQVHQDVYEAVETYGLD